MNSKKLILILLLMAAFALSASPALAESAPGAVSSVSLTRGDGTVTASWDAPSGATEYHVTYSDNGGSSWTAAARPGDGHSASTITFSVDNAKTYIVGVRAGNHVGWSTWRNSAPSGPYVPPKPAPAPSVFVERGKDGVSATVKWTAYAGSDFSYYQVIVCSDAQYDGSSCSGTVYKSGAIYDAASTGPVPVSGLDAQTGYGVILQTWRTGGALKSYATIPALPPQKPKPPATPAGLTASAGNASATLDWKDPADSSITGYQYQVNHNNTSTGRFSGWGAWQSIANSAGATSHTVSGLANGSEYRFKLRALNAAGASAAAPSADPWYVAATTKPLPKPTNLTVTPSEGNLTVSWDAVTGATGYDVRSSTDGSTWTTEHSNVSDTSVSVADANGDIEQIGVRARNAGGAGPWAEISGAPSTDWLTTVQQSGASAQSAAQAQSQLAAPATITVTRDNHIDDEKLRVTWAAVTGAGGYNLACSDLGGWSWWQCGSVTSGAATTLIVDTDARNSRDLDYLRSYRVAVRAVTTSPSQASGWTTATNAHPALKPSKASYSSDKPAISFTRQTGSITLSWISPLHGQGYEVECDTYDSTQSPYNPSYTLCADVENANVVAGGTISATITSWTDSGTNYIIDDSATYDIRVRTTNAWGKSPFTLAPLIYPVVRLTVSDIGLRTATLTIANHTAAWYYKHTNTGATCDGPVAAGASTKALTSLTVGTSYTFSAYSDSACTMGNLLATAAGFTTASSVSNLTSAKNSTGGEVSLATNQAVAFTTGANASGYVLKSITVPLKSVSAAGGTNGLQLKLHAMQGTNPYSTSSAPAATALATLSGTAPTGSTWTDTTFTCSGSGCSLSANTVYFVVATFDGTEKYEWAYALTETQTAQPSGNGWDIEYGHSQVTQPPPAQLWASYSDYNLAEITFATVPNPELTASNVALTTATLTIAHHAGDWYYKHTNTGATCEGPVSGTSKDLTGLTANTSYTYSAYSDSSCTTGNLLATATGFTTFSSVSNLTSTKVADSTISTHRTQAVAFTTGPNSSGYILKSFTLPLRKQGGTHDVKMTLHAMHGTGQYSSTSAPSGTVLATLTGTAPTGISNTYTDTTFTCAGSGCKLSSGATYFVVLRTDAFPGYATAYATTETEIALPSGNGWSVEFGHYQQPGFAWGSHSDWNIAEFVFVNAPGLTSSNVAATTATLTIAHHTGDWYYKHTNTGATCDGPVSGTSKDLTGLTANTSYAYSAYSDSSCATLLATAAQFTTLVGNVASVSNLGETVGALFIIGSSTAHAQEFTTGTTTGVYKLSKLTVKFTTVINASAVTVAIHDKQSNGTPAATARTTLSGTAATGDTEFTCSTNCELDANTSYFVHVSASSDNAAYPSSTASNDQTLTPTGTGWSIADAARSQTGSWAEVSNSHAMMIKVTATVHPKLTASNVTATGATLTIANHTGAWYYKSTTTGKTTCTSAGSVTSVSLTGLTAGTSYTYSAYSDSTCTSGNLLAAAPSFTTLSTLTASNVGTTTARITIAGHTGQWWYLADTGPHTTCQGPVAAGTAYTDLTGLTAGSFYVYSAYSATGCADTVKLATAGVSTSVTVSNLGAANTGTNHSIDNYAQGFTTGDADATLLSATVQIADAFGSPNFTVSLRDAQSNGKPATTNRATLTGTAGKGQRTFTCVDGGSNDCSLDANTKYFIYVSGSSGYLSSTDSNTETLQPANNGWSIEDAMRRQTSFDLRGDGKALKIKVEAIPHESLTASSVTATGATLTINRHIGAWYYKSTTTGQTTCTSAGSVTSVSLTLTAGTSYTFSAYSDSTCTTTNLLATAAQFTTLSSVSNLGSTNAGESGISNTRQAVAFTTGSNSGGYVLKSVTVPLKKATGRTGKTVTFTLHAMQGSGQYGTTSQASATALATLTLSGTLPTDRNAYTNTTFTCSGSGCSLSSGTTYFVVAVGNDGSWDNWVWSYATTETETALPSGNGWGVGYGHYHTSGGLAWSSAGDYNLAQLIFATS